MVKTKKPLERKLIFSDGNDLILNLFEVLKAIKKYYIGKMNFSTLPLRSLKTGISNAYFYSKLLVYR